MRRLEFIGAPGVGKSTAQTIMASGNGRVLVNALRFYQIEAIAIHLQRRNIDRSLVPLISWIPWARKMMSASAPSPVVDYVSNDFEAYRLLVDYTLGQKPPSRSAVADQVNRIQWLMRDLCIDTLLKKIDSGKIAVSDELLITRGLALCIDAINDWRPFVERFIDLVPIPEFVVLIKAEQDTIRHNLMKRDGFVAPKMLYADQMVAITDFAFHKISEEKKAICFEIDNIRDMPALSKEIRRVSAQVVGD